MPLPVWEFYNVSEKVNKFAVCKVCAKEIPRGGMLQKKFNTTNLIRHLKVSHIKEYTEFSKLAAAKAEKDKERAATPLTQLTVTETYSCLDPRYTLPSRKYFTDECLPELYQTIYSHIQSLMQDDKIVSVAFTSDIWSSSVSPMSMLSLTAQFTDEKFELKRVVLHSQEFPGSHTADAIAKAFTYMFQAWGIPKEKVHVILRDNASNMAGLPSLPYMAHTLQLAVNEGILAQRAVIDVIATGRRIVGHFKHSPLAYSRLFDIQKKSNPQHLKRLQQDVPTRWNSTVAMLKSLLEQKRALCNYAADYDLPGIFTASQWKLIENMISLLDPFDELTHKISESTASAADVIPSIKALTRLLEKTQETDHGVKTVKATLLESVKRFKDIESEPLYTMCVCVCVCV